MDKLIISLTCFKNFYIMNMNTLFDLVARGIGSLTLSGGGYYSIDEARNYIGINKERRNMDRYFTKEEQEMLGNPLGSIAFGFEQVGKAMRGVVADVKRERGI
jgi:hypothetical protein